MTHADQSLKGYLAAVAARSSTPGGGSVAATIAAEGCALMSMAAEFTHADAVRGISDRCKTAINTLLSLAEADSRAFNAVMAAYKGAGELEPALAEAARVPLRVLEVCEQQLPDLQILVRDGNQNLASDTGIAALLLNAAVKASQINIQVNVASMKTAVPQDIQDGADRISLVSQQLETIAATVLSALE